MSGTFFLMKGKQFHRLKISRQMTTYLVITYEGVLLFLANRI